MIFSCEKCGACCRNINRWKEIVNKLSDFLGEVLEFPYKDIDGQCEYLQNDNSCAIYDIRPNVCRTDYIYSLLKKKSDMSIEQFLALQLISCKINQKNCNMNPKY